MISGSGQAFGRLSHSETMAHQQPASFAAVLTLINKLQQICTQLGDTAGNSILIDKLSSIVVVGGQVSSLAGRC